MPVLLLYFAGIREAVGHASETIDLPPDVVSVADLVTWLVLKSPSHAQAFSDQSRLRVAVDQTMAVFETSVRNAREIAFFPPVTGG